MVDTASWDWNAIGAFVGVLALVVTVALYAMSRKRKRFAWCPEAKTSIVRKPKGAESRLSVTFDGQPVANADLVLLRMRNAGNQTITTTDFEDTLRVQFEAEAGKDSPRVLSVEPVKLSNPAMQVKATIEDGRVVVHPVLLNEGDSVQLRIIGENLAHAKLALHGRLSGIPTLVQERAGEQRSTQRAAILTGLIVLFAAAMMWPTTQLLVVKYLMMPTLLGFMVVLTFLQFKDPERYRALAQKVRL